MEKKTNLLSNLKKQVLALKCQLDVLEKNKHKSSKTHSHHRSISYSSRFNSNTLDSTSLSRGLKKFPLADSKFKNISEVIKEKSFIDPTPKISTFRKAEYEKTKENFSTERTLTSPVKRNCGNPLTGEGYSSNKKGIKTLFS